MNDPTDKSATPAPRLPTSETLKQLERDTEKKLNAVGKSLWDDPRWRRVKRYEFRMKLRHGLFLFVFGQIPLALKKTWVRWALGATVAALAITALRAIPGSSSMRNTCLEVNGQGAYSEFCSQIK